MWLAWSQFRVVIPTWDRTLGALVACLDTMLRTLGGAPTHLLTDNEKTVTIEHVPGVAVRHPDGRCGPPPRLKGRDVSPMTGVQGRLGVDGEGAGASVIPRVSQAGQATSGGVSG